MLMQPQSLDDLSAQQLRDMTGRLLAELRHAVGLRDLSQQSLVETKAVASKAALPAFKQYRDTDGRFYFKLADADGNVLVQAQVAAPHWTVPQDVWSSAMAGGGFAIEVAQLSDTFGAGPYARRMINA